MKHLFHLLIVSLVSFSATAQQNYIELSVSETVQLKATEFTYEVSVGELSAYDMMMDGAYDREYDELEVDEDEIEAPKPTAKEILAKLTKANFSCEISDEKSYNVTSKDAEPTIMVTVTTIKELNRLRDFIQELDGVTGKIADTKFEAPSIYYDDAYPRLMAMAKKRADLLASVSGKKAGGVIQVSEGKLSNSSSGDVWGDYMTSIMEMASIMEGKKFVATKTEVIALTYRFELKD
jgi:hypothetical protein